MGFKCGIVGLPNIGKSTLFNALTNTAAAAAANYPFCTIEPNVGQVPVPDDRLYQLAKIGNSAKIIETQLSFVDIAGLVRGASKGEGLGNQFLGNIREVDAIVHVLRCFEDDDITHVSNRIDPIDDLETIETELLLSDLESVEKRHANAVKKARGNDKEALALKALFEKLLPLLQDGKPARLFECVDESEELLFNQLQLLTAKPVLYACNVDEGSAANGNNLSQAVAERAVSEGARAVVICASIEAEIAQLDAEERTIFLEDLGLAETGLAQVIREGYRLLDLITYFTIGPKEARAWTVAQGSTAPQSAGVIHTDFETGFIRAETISFEDFVHCDGEQGAKDAGKMRLEGKEYLTQDGDVMHFRFAN